MQLLNNVTGAVSVMLTLIFGVYLSFKTRFFQFKGLKKALKTVLKDAFKKNEKNSASSKGAVCTALAATIGTGNIVGVSGAIALCGAGVVFWIALASVFAMIIKYAEIYTAVETRKLVDGVYRGGAMYGAKYNLKKTFLPIGYAFAFLTVLASFGTGNLIQINTSTLAVKEIFKGSLSFEISLAFCVVSAIFIGYLLLSGIGAVCKFCERVIPIMLGLYVAASIYVLAINYDRFFLIVSMILNGALNPKAVTGGAVVSVFLTVKIGVVRGIVSNEAGMGSASIAHGSATADKQGEAEYGILEVFIDTFVSIITAIVILLGNQNIVYGKDTGLSCVLLAFKNSFGASASFVLCLFLILFGISSVLGWGAYGTVCAEFLWNKRGGYIYKMLFAAASVLGGIVSVEKIWSVSEILNSLVCVPNIIIVYFLFKKVSD